jgi:hypothetical protein
MGEFQVATDVLQSSADGLESVVDRLAEALRKLETTLQAQGAPWGTGLVGSTLGDLYLDVHDLAMGTLENNGEVMSEYSQGLDSMATELRELEEMIESGLDFFEDKFGDRFPTPQ